MSKKTLEVVKQTKNDAVIQIKSNQKSLYNSAKFISGHNTPLSTFTQRPTKNHGRLETRKVQVFTIPELSRALDKKWRGWESIVCFVKVERNRKPFDTKKKCYDKSKIQVSYYLSTKLFDAKTFADIIQSHWGIENKVNYVKDVQFKEDLSRIRVKPGIFSRLRGMPKKEAIDEDEISMMKEYFDDYYASALDEKIAVLNNQTPRECAKNDPKRVIRWLKMLDENETTKKINYDTDWIWKELEVKK